jgi:hypothetical protein
MTPEPHQGLTGGWIMPERANTHCSGKMKTDFIEASDNFSWVFELVDSADEPGGLNSS